MTATTPATPAKSAGCANQNTLEKPSSAAGRSRQSMRTVARPKFARNAGKKSFRGRPLSSSE